VLLNVQHRCVIAVAQKRDFWEIYVQHTWIQGLKMHSVVLQQCLLRTFYSPDTALSSGDTMLNKLSIPSSMALKELWCRLTNFKSARSLFIVTSHCISEVNMYQNLIKQYAFYFIFKWSESLREEGVFTRCDLGSDKGDMYRSDHGLHTKVVIQTLMCWLSNIGINILCFKFTFSPFFLQVHYACHPNTFLALKLWWWPWSTADLMKREMC
jgi:hypothetical protein